MKCNVKTSDLVNFAKTTDIENIKGIDAAKKKDLKDVQEKPEENIDKMRKVMRNTALSYSMRKQLSKILDRAQEEKDIMDKQDGGNADLKGEDNADNN